MEFTVMGIANGKNITKTTGIGPVSYTHLNLTPQTFEMSFSVEKEQESGCNNRLKGMIQTENMEFQSENGYAEQLNLFQMESRSDLLLKEQEYIPFSYTHLSLHHADDPLYNEGEYPLVTGEKGKELLSYVPYYANHPLVQEAVKELEQLESQQKKSKKRGRER